MPALITPKDVYQLGAPRGVFQADARLVARVDVTANTFELDNHGLTLDDEVQFRADDDADLPAPLAAGTSYYAIPIDEWRFSVSATEGGAAVNLTDEGGAFAVMIAEEDARVTAAIEAASEVLERHLIAHAVPLDTPIPADIRRLVAVIAAYELAAALGRSVPALTTRQIDARKDLETYARGVRAAGVTTSGNLARGASPSASSGGGWYSGDTIP